MGYQPVSSSSNAAPPLEPEAAGSPAPSHGVERTGPALARATSRHSDSPSAGRKRDFRRVAVGAPGPA
eukprot:55408-Rhodomonas_salina.1